MSYLAKICRIILQKFLDKDSGTDDVMETLTDQQFYAKLLTQTDRETNKRQENITSLTELIGIALETVVVADTIYCNESETTGASECIKLL